LVRYVAFVLIVGYAIYRPQSAADILFAIGGGIMDIATGWGDFFGAWSPPPRSHPPAPSTCPAR